MSHPTSMQTSIQKVKATRKERMDSLFPELNITEKAKLLERYHPDFNHDVKRELKIGVNKGDLAPFELADLLEAPSRLRPDEVNLDNVDYETDILVVGSGGGGLSAALTISETGTDVIIATKLRMGDSNTIMAEGGIGAATTPEDSPLIHYVDTLVGGRGKNIPELVDALVRDTRRLLPVSLFLDGEYEIENVAMSIPAVVGSDGVQKVHLPRLEKDELESLRISAAKMKDFLERRRP